MTFSEELKRRARQGDLSALQELRDSGFFRRKGAGRGHALSPAQRRLWVQEQLAGWAAAYNMPAALALEGALDAGALRRALCAVVERHESLRTTFGEFDGEPRQVVRDEATFAWEECDLSGEADAPAAARHHAARLANLRFDLRQGPLLR